jgi:hypothetical protein
VRVLPPGLDPIKLDATLRQRPLLPRRLFWLMSALIAIAVVLVFIVSTLLRQRPVSMAGPAPTAPPSAPRTTGGTPNSAPPAAMPTTSPPTARPPLSPGSGGEGGSGQSATTTTFTVQASAFPGASGGPQLFSYVVPDGPNYLVTSVLLGNPDGDAGDLQIWHDDRVLATFSLATIHGQPKNQINHRFPQPPMVRSGQLITLAVTCSNPENPCRPTGRFTATLVR